MMRSVCGMRVAHLISFIASLAAASSCAGAGRTDPGAPAPTDRSENTYSPAPTALAVKTAEVVDSGVVPASVLAGEADAGPPAADGSVATPCAPPPGPFAGYRVGSVHVYKMVETVNTHAQSNPIKRLEGTATFTVKRVECVGAATSVHGDWVLEGETSGIVGTPESWLLEGRRIIENGVVGEDHPSFIAADGASKTPGGVCQTSTSEQLYGRGLYQVCIDKLGLLSLRAENFSGPRKFVFRRK